MKIRFLYLFRFLFCAHWMFCIATMPVCASSANLVFSCASDNNLYQATSNTLGINYPRFESALDAVNNAATGSGVLILADAYPGSRTSISSEVYNVAAAKNLRLYIEYPETVPGLSFSGSFVNSCDRLVVDDNSFFGTELQQYDILDAHESTFLTLSTSIPESDQYLRLGLVAGYETAVYGYSGITTKPVLFEYDSSGFDSLIATNQLSNFVTGRYLPNAKWQSVWDGVFQWLAPGSDEVNLTWTPALVPAYSETATLPADAQRTALNRGIQWYTNCRLLIHEDWYDEFLGKSESNLHQLWPDASYPNGDGSLGILEGTANPIYYDGQQAIRWCVRNDSLGPCSMSFALHGLVNNNAQSKAIAENLVNHIHNSRISDGVRSNPGNPNYGMRGWMEQGSLNQVYYSDDIARSLLGQIGAAAALESDQWNEQIVTQILSSFRVTGTGGFWGSNRLSENDLNNNGWRYYYDRNVTNVRPHYESWKWANFLWLYDKTGYQPLLDRTKAGIQTMMEAFEDDTIRWTNGIQQERARMILPLAWLLRVEDTAQTRQWLDTIVDELLADQDASGAIREELGRAGYGSYPAPSSNDQFGKSEAPVIQENGDPCVDLLYTSNFAFKGLIEAAAVTGDPKIQQMLDKLSDFLVRIQVTSETSELDGSWVRAFDYERWDYWGSDSDAGWGTLGDQAGWTHAEITSGLALRELDTTLWDLSADFDCDDLFTQVLTHMFELEHDPFDLNYDGVFDINDFFDVLLANMGADLSQWSTVMSAALGDFDGDLDVDMEDFVRFRNAYDSAYGAGAFAYAAAHPVCEPSTFVLILIGVFAFVVWRIVVKFRTRYFKMFTAGKIFFLLAVTASIPFNFEPALAQDIEGVTYSYLQDTIDNVTLGGDTAESYSSPSLLTDGNYGQSLLLPDRVWDDGRGGVIYQLEGDAHSQPGLVMQLPEVEELGFLRIHYLVRQASAVVAPSSLEVAIDGATLPTFEDFNNSQTYYSGQGGEVRVALVDLNGYIGNELQLDFRNNRYQRLANGEHLGEWTGLTEIEVFRKAPLQLTVDREQGYVFLQNTSDVATSLNGYQIASENGLLLPSSWNSLDDQDYAGGSAWQESGTLDATSLAEMYLTGDSELAAGQSISLGKIFDVSSPLEEFDLSFRYSAAGMTWVGQVDYQNPMTSYNWAVLKDNPKFYYSFNESGAGQAAVDSVRGQGNDGLKATGVGGAVAAREASQTANLGQAAVFDGSTFFASQGMDDGKTCGAWAVELWVKDEAATPGETNCYLTNFIAPGGQSNSPAVIYGYDDNQIEFYSNSSGRSGTDGPTIDDNNWHHVVMTFYGDGIIGAADRVDYAVDGVVGTMSRNEFTKQLDMRDIMVVGASKLTGIDAFTGKIDELAIYDLSGLSETEIASKMVQLAGHYALASEPAGSVLSYVDTAQITYSYDLGYPSANYPDSSGRELVDGQFGSTATTLPAEWVGIQDIGSDDGTAQTQITFDLGETVTLDSIWIDYAGGGSAGVEALDWVEISLSTDGINFDTPISFDDFNNASLDEDADSHADYFYARRLIAEIEGKEATHVRMRFFSDGEWAMLSEIQFIEYTGVAPKIPGDANNDGRVDGSDVTILAGNWQVLTNATWEMGDFNGDGKVDGSDVTILAGNWQKGVTATTASVPEPSIPLLLIAALGPFFLWKRHS